MAVGSRIYGLGAVALGLVGLAFADFALQWQPVPKAIPAREIFAYASAAILILAGAALFVRRWAALGAAALASFYGLWVVALHLPRVLAKPADLSIWLGVAEIGALTAAGLIAWAATAGMDKARRATVVRLGRYLFGLCLLVFGASHFVYAAFTAGMIPKWIPGGGLFWAYATGLAHVAAGLALLSGRMMKLAARLLTLMFAGFIALLLAPLAAADPSSHIAWCMLGVTLALTGAAWTVADEV